MDEDQEQADADQAAAYQAELEQREYEQKLLRDDPAWTKWLTQLELEHES